MITCCGKDSSWVENIPGKGYWFCQECRKEVNTPDISEIGDDAGNDYDYAYWTDKSSNFSPPGVCNCAGCQAVAKHGLPQVVPQKTLDEEYLELLKNSSVV